MQRHMPHRVRRVVRLALSCLLASTLLLLVAGRPMLPRMQRHTLLRQAAHHPLGRELMRGLRRLERGRRRVGHIFLLLLLLLLPLLPLVR
jgi:hypothetical protein